MFQTTNQAILAGEIVITHQFLECQRCFSKEKTDYETRFYT